MGISNGFKYNRSIWTAHSNHNSFWLFYLEATDLDSKSEGVYGRNRGYTLKTYKWRTKEVSDSLKAVGTSVSTIMVNVWNIVPEALGALLIVLNIIYIILKIKKEY